MLIGSFFDGMSEFEEPDGDWSVRMLISQLKLFAPIVTYEEKAMKEIFYSPNPREINRLVRLRQ